MNNTSWQAVARPSWHISLFVVVMHTSYVHVLASLIRVSMVVCSRTLFGIYSWGDEAIFKMADFWWKFHDCSWPCYILPESWANKLAMSCTYVYLHIPCSNVVIDQAITFYSMGFSVLQVRMHFTLPPLPSLCAPVPEVNQPTCPSIVLWVELKECKTLA